MVVVFSRWFSTSIQSHSKENAGQEQNYWGHGYKMKTFFRRKHKLNGLRKTLNHRSARIMINKSVVYHTKKDFVGDKNRMNNHLDQIHKYFSIINRRNGMQS
jgi:hypothetical protein